MELMNYGLSSSSGPQQGGEGVNEWLDYESMQNGGRLNQTQEYANANANMNANVNVNTNLSVNVNANVSPNLMGGNVNVSGSIGHDGSMEKVSAATGSAEKAAHEDEQPENEPYSIVNTAEQAKRKKGRPPKDHSSVSPICVQVKEDAVVVAKRGRGRPPKNASGVVPPICIQMNEDSVVVPKNKPGRPPKAKGQTTTLLTDFGEMLEGPDGSAVATPKRRGRPPKAKTPAEQEALANKPKGKRGRPPKPKVHDGSSVSPAPKSDRNSDVYRLEPSGPDGDEDHFLFEGHSDGSPDRTNVSLDPNATTSASDLPKRKRGRPPKDKSGEPPRPRSPPKPKRQPGEPPRKRGRPPKSAKVADNINGGMGVTKLQLDAGAFDGSQSAGDLSYGVNSSETEVFGFGDGPTTASANTNVSVALNGGGDAPKRKRGRPPMAKAPVATVMESA